MINLIIRIITSKMNTTTQLSSTNNMIITTINTINNLKNDWKHY